MKIDFLKPRFPKFFNIKNYFASIYKQGIYTNHGPIVQGLEARMKDLFEFDGDVIAVANGTLALIITLKAYGVKKALVPAFTFPATLQALKWADVEYSFLDIDPLTWTVSIEDLERKLQEYEPDVLVPVHSFGNPCDVKSISRLAAIHNCKVVYDAAPAISSFYTEDNKNNHICNYGDASCFSLHATKVLPAGEGGVICIKDKLIAAKIRRMINFGFEEDRIPHDEFGINAKLSEFHAAFALSGIDKLALSQRDRLSIVQQYHSKLKDIVQFQNVIDNSISSYQVLSVCVQENSSDLAQRIVDTLKEKYEIECRRYYNPPLHQTDVFKRDIDLPYTEDICKRIITLPLHLYLKEDEIDYIIDSFQKTYLELA